MEKIILASSSPRRKEILNRYHLNPIIFGAEIEEKQIKGELPEQVAMSLAFEKSYWVSNYFSNGEIIIGADTIVVSEDMILGKPKDEKDAFRILSLLNGKEHSVITGICIIRANTNIKIIDYENTTVRFRHLSEEQIMRYIHTNEPMDKAGAYGIQGYGQILVEKINGCYSNVVGLPLGKLDYLLNKFFNVKIL
ncbi:septum formation protein Maf [Tissierella carlieri]|jgi:septum formation protein|uniref:dTTP/UTP pyrophosphatase n=1 Tax=Tissierella carlieri TaxID=689904 RepID=A0ABT1SB53_9FIRM|nr:Maf family protein [Tissierella carlieri]MBU5311203.1 septum formation protein Maf [Tissierella carlieri]MCQ4923712.1 Maf family protein [Tissierella carlieri]